MKLTIIVIICMSFIVFSSTDIMNNKEVSAKDCVCGMVVECYYPGYQPGDLPFASKIVYSCADAKEYRQYISTTKDQLIFFFIHPCS